MGLRRSSAGACVCVCVRDQNDALQRELDDLRAEKEERERELLDEGAQLQENVAKMRAELEAIMKELQDLMDTKLGLELEIAAYRKLLEGEENRYFLSFHYMTTEVSPSGNRGSPILSLLRFIFGIGLDAMQVCHRCQKSTRFYFSH